MKIWFGERTLLVLLEFSMGYFRLGFVFGVFAYPLLIFLISEHFLGGLSGIHGKLISIVIIYVIYIAIVIFYIAHYIAQKPLFEERDSHYSIEDHEIFMFWFTVAFVLLVYYYIDEFYYSSEIDNNKYNANHSKISIAILSFSYIAIAIYLLFCILVFSVFSAIYTSSWVANWVWCFILALSFLCFVTYSVDSFFIDKIVLPVVDWIFRFDIGKPFPPRRPTLWHY